MENYVAKTLERFGRIDGFFNNAGIEGRQNLTEAFTAAEFDRVVSINLRGAFLGLEKVLKVMHEQGSGMVVNTASVGGIRGIGNQSGYAASQHGLVGLTRNSGIEYRPLRHPHQRHRPRRDLDADGRGLDEAAERRRPARRRRAVHPGNPTKRYGEAPEIASVVAFLLSDDASYVNATVVPIDGGQSAAY